MKTFLFYLVMFLCKLCQTFQKVAIFKKIPNQADFSCLWSLLKRNHTVEGKWINLYFYTITAFPLIPA